MVSGPVQLVDLRGQHKSVRQARPRDRAIVYANSDVLRNGLAKGDHQIAHAAVDNAVAMVELAKADVAIVTGGATLQPHLRPAGDQRLRRTPRQDGRGRRPIPRLPCCSTSAQDTPQQGDYVVKPVGGTTAARGHDQRQSECRRACSIRRYVPRQRRRIEGHGAAAKASAPSSAAFVMREWARPTATRSCAISAPVQRPPLALDPPTRRSHRAARRSSQARAAVAAHPTRWRRSGEGIARTRIGHDGFKTCSSCARRSKDNGAAVRRHPRNISICRITIAPWRASDDGPSLARRGSRSSIAMSSR